MIDYEKVLNLIQSIPILESPNRKQIWEKCLGVDPSDYSSNLDYNTELIRRAIIGCVGQFNYWEQDHKIMWSGLNSNDWFKVIREEKPIKEMNLVDIRSNLLKVTENFIKNNVISLSDPIWWNALSSTYGGDPLKKRETLLWIMFDDLGINALKNIPIPNRGCIDYNIILYLRYNKIITGYKGNTFELYEETRLRMECLDVINRILNIRKDLTISSLDEYLYSAGRVIRRTVNRSEWDPYFCYRFGCFFY